MLKQTRIESIDLLRGIVMIVMALDHTRDYFHADAFLYDPTDLDKTSVALFFTRWITHFCAPVFMFLAGTSAFITGIRKGSKELSVFLLKRGLWLIFLEITFVNFGWLFNIHFTLSILAVIWAIGVSMVALAAFIHLPRPAILLSGLLLVAGHNMLDNYHVEGTGGAAILWSLLHERSGVQLNADHSLFIGYPVLPWIGIILLGYCFGTFYAPTYDSSKRKKMLVYIGTASIIIFVVLRYTNLYGDALHWSTQTTPVFTILSFLKVTKYPPSLLYALVTLGPAILFLAFAEKITGKFAQKIIVLGRVPMFYYLLHIYLLHILAVVAAILTGFAPSTMVFSTWVTNSPALRGYGFSLGVVYLIWVGVVMALYPLCKWYDTYKTNHREQWWLSYL